MRTVATLPRCALQTLVYNECHAQAHIQSQTCSRHCAPVQDFTQAELLMDLRIVEDPNGLFLCGDTAQTIARGIGFRFTGRSAVHRRPDR